MTFSEFQIDFDTHKLACDCCGEKSSCPLVILHGAGNGTRERFTPLRQKLNSDGFASLALDFIGHGKTGGQLASSSLSRRDDQARELIRSSNVSSPLRLLGSSMGAYNAIKLAETNDGEALILFVPGVYSRESYNITFGPEFSNVIRRERNWEATDAWEILSKFEGDLLIVAAGKDPIIPREIPERLYESAAVARSRELHWVKDSPHLLVHYLNENASAMETVFDKIRSILPKGV
jgi:pimeloyl-ACP methyl ester carboxylesterase